MKRMKKHAVKKERPETSAYDKVLQEHDLAYYIDDRVELMHQVFSVIKARDIRSMAPESVRKTSIDDLQELCTEELLGISSKRLCAVLDGAEPPSDTESSSRSSSPPMETISLDSISSDDDLLSQTSKRRKKKRRSSKSKAKKDKTEKKKKSQSEAPVAPPIEVNDQSRASRAGLTVLELLELQARARAIRAQLQQEQARKALEPGGAAASEVVDDDEDVEIKEEQPEIVEISSEDDEKPDLAQLAKTTTSKQPESVVNGKATEAAKSKDKDKNTEKKKKDKSKKKKKDKHNDKSKGDSEVVKTTEVESHKEVSTTSNVVHVDDSSLRENNTEPTNIVTKRVNDLIITVPKQVTRKIKLNRNRSKVTVSIDNSKNNVSTESRDVAAAESATRVSSVVTKPPERLSSTVSKPDVRAKLNEIKKKSVQVKENITTNDTNKKETPDKSVVKQVIENKDKKKDKTKKKAKKRDKQNATDNSDQDEITLQLSDSEKMDLLEDLDRKQYERVSSSEDSESSTDSDSDSDSDSVDSNDDKEKSPKESVVQDNFYKGIENLEKDSVVENTVSKNTHENEACYENAQKMFSSENENLQDEVNTDNNEDLQTKDKDEENVDESSDSDSDSETSQDSEDDTQKINNEPCTTIHKNTDSIQQTEVNETVSQLVVVEDIPEQQSDNLFANQNESDNNVKNTVIEKLGYISIDDETERNNIEIADIRDIPVINDEASCANENEPCSNISMAHNVTADVAESLKEQNKATDDTEVVSDDLNPVISEKCDENDTREKTKTLPSEMSSLNTSKPEQIITEKVLKLGTDMKEMSENIEETIVEQEREMSEGEVSTAESSEVEAMELKPVVVCISDEEEQTSAKKKKKKDKKAKKEKKSKKSKSDFRECGDQNFYTERQRETNAVEILEYKGDSNKEVKQDIIENLDTISLGSNEDVYEILELSDDSSCYEVEGTVLSKEPTAEQIAALSAKIDEIERNDIITDEQIQEHERMLKEKGKDETAKENVFEKESNKIIIEQTCEDKEHEENIENVSWKDRYLGSKKVKKVLTTSNILNALRKKNKELKKKLQESKLKEAEELRVAAEKLKDIPVVENKDLEEGSMEQYNALQGSTKYVDPITEPVDQLKTSEENNTEGTHENPEETQDNPEDKQDAEARLKNVQIEVTGEMKKDAKQLLKMYKKLLKYNDITKQRDPNKVKKKKKKSKKK